MNLSANKRKALKSVIAKLDDIIVKCGGEGGTPGPCPSGNATPTGGGGVPKKLQKFIPKSMDASKAGKELTISKGAVAFDIGSGKAVAPKYSFNTETKIKILGTVKRGTGEFEKTDYVVHLGGSLSGGGDGKLLQVPSTVSKLND